MKRVAFGVADVRRKPKFRSERISQLIFGEEVKALGNEDGYLRVVGPDGLEGYMQETLLSDASGDPKYKLASRHSSGGLLLPFGSYLTEEEASRFKVPKRLLVPVGSKHEPTKLAEAFLGVPYLWGGTSDFGYDCSGFTQRLYRFSGVELPRNSNWQRDAGKKVKGFDEAKPGDLVFFAGHVALLLHGRAIIHANLSHGGVSVTDLSDGSRYSRHLMDIFQGIRRFR
ncbi:MAG: C40 family peptidase [Nitrososphaerota archaeon]|nr:C40 family peptidase [Nitrososphaerota archaeon]